MRPIPEFKPRPRVDSEIRAGNQLAERAGILREQLLAATDSIEIHNLLIESPRVVNELSDVSLKEHNNAGYGTGLGLGLIIISPSFPPATGILVGLGLWMIGGGISFEVFSQIHQRAGRRLQEVSQRFIQS